MVKSPQKEAFKSVIVFWLQEKEYELSEVFDMSQDAVIKAEVLSMSEVNKYSYQVNWNYIFFRLGVNSKTWAEIYLVLSSQFPLLVESFIGKVK